MEKVLVVYAIETTDCISALGQEIKIPTTKIRNQIVTLEDDVLNEAIIEEIENTLMEEEDGWNLYLINIINLTTK